MPHRTERLSAVYVIKLGELYKIGVSVDPEQRFASMMLPSKPDVILIYRCRKAMQLEQTLHRKYAEQRQHGEWFKLEKPQLIEIARVCEAWKRQVEA